jgi:hypothetical protein
MNSIGLARLGQGVPHRGPGITSPYACAAGFGPNHRGKDMSGKLVKVLSTYGGGTTKVDLDRCQEFSIGPPINPGGPSADWSQYHIYYLTPDLRWIIETHRSDRVYYQETTRNAVKNHAFRVGYFSLPPELQTEDIPNKKTTASPPPPPTRRPPRPGPPTITFFADPEEIRQIRGISTGIVKSADEEKTAGAPPAHRRDEQPVAAPASGTMTREAHGVDPPCEETRHQEPNAPMDAPPVTSMLAEAEWALILRAIATKALASVRAYIEYQGVSDRVLRMNADNAVLSLETFSDHKSKTNLRVDGCEYDLSHEDILLHLSEHADSQPEGNPTAKFAPNLSPAARAIAAAYDLQKEGKPVNLKSACDRARVDRGHLRKKYPEAVKMIRQINTADRTPKRGVRDRRSGDIDAIDDAGE